MTIQNIKEMLPQARSWTLGLLLFLIIPALLLAQDSKPIDRYELVNRHNVYVSQIDTMASLTVGNGSFAYTVDVTGLQTFPQTYEKGIPLGTQSEWGWHSFPNTGNYTMEDVAEIFTTRKGKKVPYATQHDSGRKAQATHYLRTNPHRLHLGIVGLLLQKENGEEATPSDIDNVQQVLNLWTGKIESRFTFDGHPVHVVLYGHQNRDQISARIESPLVSNGQLKLRMRFPYGSDCHVCPGYDWNSPEKHSTKITSLVRNAATLQRTLDTTQYIIDLSWEGEAAVQNPEKHEYILAPEGDSNTLTFSVLFSNQLPDEGPDSFKSTRLNSIKRWKEFWSTGGAIDFSGSADPRADELERRVILSQYLTKIQTTGLLPPQETGLTMNSWYGKFHLEMHWWHGVHFALWNRTDLLERSLDWYNTALPRALGTANWQGYDGARWQKMTGPNGRKGPSDVGEFLVWQQPHIIYYAEELYRQDPSQKILENYKERVFATADFMADFAALDESDGYYHLDPPLIPAQELFDPLTTRDPPFEVAYWHYGLTVAQQWRERLGLDPDPQWQQVINNLAPLATKDGLYLPDRNSPQAYTEDRYRHDHPMVVGTYGLIPSHEVVDTEIMKRTYNEVFNDWNWSSTWGWDYPMMAMAATKLGMPEKAVDALFMDVQKNTDLKNGHNYQDERLRLYLPGNGALLSAVALMAAGWENGPDTETPGFPDEGWNVKWENIREMQ